MLQYGATQVVVAIPEEFQDVAEAALAGLGTVSFVTGDHTRQGSVRKALERFADADMRGDVRTVLIHDAARPQIAQRVVAELTRALDSHDGAIPVLPVVDSLAVAQDGMMAGKADREALRRVQTPQAFRFDAILAAHRGWTGALDAGDDAQVLAANGGTVTLVAGDEAARKITFAEDFAASMPDTNGPLPVRTGMGYDVHRLAAGEELWLGGVCIPHDRGLAGHSDADVAIHAIVDALLGAVGAGDIGRHFPPSDDRWAGASSDRFLDHATKLVDQAGYRIGNIDLTIICEAPKIGPYRETMQRRLAEILTLPAEFINVKATTTERLGFTGREEGIAAQAVATIVLKNPC